MTKDKIALKEKRNELVRQAREMISEAEKLSDEIGEGFDWGLAYGMGGYYHPAGDPNYNESNYSDSDSTVGEWVSSSANC